MDYIVAKALVKKRELERSLKEIETFLSQYELLTGTKIVHDEMLGGIDTAYRADTSGDSVIEVAPSQKPRTKRNSNDPKEVALHAANAISEAGRPLSRSEIVEALESGGLEIHSDDKPRYVGTIMWRNQDTFENVEGRGYWLKGVDLPRRDNDLI